MTAVVKSDVPIPITPSRNVQRIDTHHAVMYCQCGAAEPFERTDGEPLTNGDLVEAITTWDHEHSYQGRR
jgi:hypothetical protein